MYRGLTTYHWSMFDGKTLRVPALQIVLGKTKQLMTANVGVTAIRAKVRLHKTEIREVNIPDRTSRTGAGKRKVPAVLVRTAAPRIAVDRSAAVLRAPQRAAAQAAERFGQWSLEQPEDF